jgi:hypothetical protein
MNALFGNSFWYTRHISGWVVVLLISTIMNGVVTVKFIDYVRLFVSTLLRNVIQMYIINRSRCTVRNQEGTKTKAITKMLMPKCTGYIKQGEFRWRICKATIEVMEGSSVLIGRVELAWNCSELGSITILARNGGSEWRDDQFEVSLFAHTVLQASASGSAKFKEKPKQQVRACKIRFPSVMWTYCSQFPRKTAFGATNIKLNWNNNLNNFN